MQDCSDLNSGDWYGYDTAYIDLDRIGPAIFSDFHAADNAGLLATDDRLDFVYRPTHDHRHPSVWRSLWPAVSRHLPSFLSRCPLGPVGDMESAGRVSDPEVRSFRNDPAGSGRYRLSPYRPEGRRGWLVAGCSPFDPQPSGLCLGSEPGDPDPAGYPALGRDAPGIADSHEGSSQGWRLPDRSGLADAWGGVRGLSGAGFSRTCRRILCLAGRPASIPGSSDLPPSTGCCFVRLASPATPSPTGPVSQTGTTVALSPTDGPTGPDLATGSDLRTRAYPNPTGLCPTGPVVQGQPDPDAAGHQSRSPRQRAGRLFPLDRFDIGGSNRHWGICRPMVYRGDPPQCQTVSGWAATPDLERSGTRTRGGGVADAVFAGLELVSSTEQGATDLDGTAMVCHQRDPQLSRCPDGPAADALASENNSDVRIPVRTTSKYDAPYETPVRSGVTLHENLRKST